MNLKLEIEFSKAPILQEVDDLKRQIDEMRPLSPEIEGRVMQKLRLDWNYNSNAIEGNKLSYGETTALLMHGITAKGKPLKDHLDIQGHNKALEYLDSLVKDGRGFSEMDIRGLHEVVLVEPYDSPAKTSDGAQTTKRIEIGKYKSSSNHVETITGEIHYYPEPGEIAGLMSDLMDWYNSAITDSSVHPAVVAALFHYKFVAIHPFDDGNGRLARILMNLILMQRGYPPVVIKTDDKQNYYSLLSQADIGESWPFVEYIVERLQSSLELYLKAANGGDIDEDEDIDKEIALFRMELQSRVKVKDKKSKSTVKLVIDREVVKLIEKALKGISKFTEFFLSEIFYVRMYYLNLVGDKYVYEHYSIDSFYSHMNNTIEFTKQFDEVEIVFTLKEFRDPDNAFDIQIWFAFKFEEYEYKVINDNGDFITKLYHETISTQESNNIVKNVIISAKKNIEESLKAPNQG